MLKKNGLKAKTASGLIYSFAERMGAQFISFLVSIVLARILMPDEYGCVAIVTVLISICDVFVTQGLGTALIQKKDADDIDFSTVFYANVVFSIVLYIFLFISAPFIASFYDYPVLDSVIRVMGVKIILSSVNSIQNAFISRRMMFKKFFYATLIGTIVSAFVGIGMAYKGLGVWALVGQYLTNSAIDTLMLVLLVRWVPRKVFSWTAFKSLFSYGWKILTAGVIDEVYKELRTLTIGKMYSTTDLAFFNKGSSFPNLLMSNVNTAINTVMFPVMASAEREQIKGIMKRTLKTSTFLVFPMMVGLSFVSKNLVGFLLTDKWIECVPYLQVYCAVYAMYPIITLNKAVIKALGRSDTYLKMEVFKKMLFVIILLSFVRYGTIWVAYSMLISIFIETVINAYPTGKYIHYGWFEQVKDICPALINSFIMGAIVYAVGLIGLNPGLELVLQVIVGSLAYLLVCILTKSPELKYMYSFVCSHVLRK